MSARTRTRGWTADERTAVARVLGTFGGEITTDDNPSRWRVEQDETTEARGRTTTARSPRQTKRQKINDTMEPML